MRIEIDDGKILDEIMRENGVELKGMAPIEMNSIAPYQLQFPWSGKVESRTTTLLMLRYNIRIGDRERERREG